MNLIIFFFSAQAALHQRAHFMGGWNIRRLFSGDSSAHQNRRLVRILELDIEPIPLLSQK